ncbi:site-specific integrase [Nitrincola iocasae]|uniref:Site-specific integrase n=1 Tax=Nitrincola iocasae TaxID=2614693 RepID=A0A5J6LFU5_9GAMM|nr:site-specific integrase [Nitrincola iocasae]QEW07318.1 site-specific integrase [Nitrincola iocasae]
MAKAITYLEQSRHAVYYFRIRVPNSLKTSFPCSEVRRSLGTKCRRLAILRGAKLLEQVEELFSQAGRGEIIDLKRLSWSEPFEFSRPPAVVNASVLELEPERTSPKMSIAFQRYLETQKLEGVGEKTLGDKRSIFELLVRVVGDMPVHCFQRKHAQKFKEIALKLPPRSNRKCNVTLERLITEAETTISTTTFNNYMKYLSAFFTWLLQEEYSDKNYFDGLRVKQRTKASLGRSIFSEEDLRHLFCGAIPLCDHPRPYQHWLPLLALYSGARMGELCQLYVDDIMEINGIHCIYIREGRADQKLKTPSSERVIPIHSKLKDAGFMGYVKQRRQQGPDTLLFDLVKHKRHGYAATPSKWFGRLREKLGFKDNRIKERKDFHSFRHTVADHLKQLGVAESLVAGLLGHQTGGITFSRYGKDFKPEMLQPVVEQLAFNIDQDWS